MKYLLSVGYGLTAGTLIGVLAAHLALGTYARRYSKLWHFKI